VLFAVYINDVITAANHSKLGYLFAYADDLLLIARSLSALQKLAQLVNLVLRDLVLTVNTAKSFCMRVGPRFDAKCCLIELNGQRVAWSSEVRYLGIYFVAGRRCEVSFDYANKSFNRGVNAILGRIGTRCDIHLLAHLIDAKCTPALLYGIEACGANQRTIKSLDFIFKRYFLRYLKPLPYM
jgi:hypothetical protein